MTEPRCKNGKCGRTITPREVKLNSGVCDDCFIAALRARFPHGKRK